MDDTDSNWTIAAHLEAGDEQSIALFRRMQEVIDSFGPGSTSVSKTTVTFKGTRRGFAGGRPTRRGLIGYLDLTRELPPDSRITSIAPYQRNLFVHHFRLQAAADFDDGFADWLREAYAVGCGAHLKQ